MIKEDEVLEDQKIIFLTAILTRDETVGGKDLISRNLFLAKPFKTKDLTYTINKVLG